MNGFISLVKDLLDEFSEAYKYAELDFYKLKTEVVELMNKAKAKGYGNPDYCEMSIKVINRLETNVTIQTYYKESNGKVRRFTKKLDLGKLVNIPTVVKTRLDKDPEVTIKLTDFEKLYEVEEKDITSTVDFNNLYKFTLKNAKGTPTRKELHIKDNLFYYQVVLVYVYADGQKELRDKYFGLIENLPQEVQDKIESTEERACFIDVTKQ